METCNSWYGPFQGKAVYRRNFRGSFSPYSVPPVQKIAITSRPEISGVAGVLRDKLIQLTAP